MHPCLLLLSFLLVVPGVVHAVVPRGGTDVFAGVPPVIPAGLRLENHPRRAPSSSTSGSAAGRERKARTLAKRVRLLEKRGLDDKALKQLHKAAELWPKILHEFIADAPRGSVLAAAARNLVTKQIVEAGTHVSMPVRGGAERLLVEKAWGYHTLEPAPWTRHFDERSNCLFYHSTAAPAKGWTVPEGTPVLAWPRLERTFSPPAPPGRPTAPNKGQCGPRAGPPTDFSEKLRADACLRRARWGVPDGEDGGRMICLDPLPLIRERSTSTSSSATMAASGATTQPCVVYSFGTADEWSFDLSAANFGCEVHAFDPAVDAEATAALYNSSGHVLDWRPGQPIGPKTFHGWGLGRRDGEYATGAAPATWPGLTWGARPNDKPWTLRSVPSVMRELGHDRIDVLKIDTEGAEWDALEALLTPPGDGSSGKSLLQQGRVGQLVVEFHYDVLASKAQRMTQDALLARLEEHGMVPFDQANAMHHDSASREVSFVYVDPDEAAAVHDDGVCEE